MKLPLGRFVMKDVMAENPGVLYITIYMRIKKMLKAKELQVYGVEHDGGRGASQKVYEVVPVKKTKRALVSA